MTDALDGNFVLRKFKTNVSNSNKVMIASVPGSLCVDQLNQVYAYHSCHSNRSDACSHICIPLAFGDKYSECWCEVGMTHDDSDYEDMECVKGDSSKKLDYENMISEEFEEIYANNSSSGTSGRSDWGYMVLLTVILVLGCIIGYFVWYWRKPDQFL